MKKFSFKKIDAFAAGKSAGNPAGAIYLDSPEEISAAEMQRIAGELKGFVSEVGYLCQMDKDLFNLKYFSSEREVDFCGHATIAIMYDLIKNRNDLLSREVVFIGTNRGRLSVYNRIKSEDAVFVSAPKPVFSDVIPPAQDIAGALGADTSIIDGLSAASIINAGLETLIVPIKSLDDILSLKPDMEELKNFCLSHSIDIITVFTRETFDKQNDYRTRVFAPTFGYLEDPATGSGNAAFGYYLQKNGKWQGSILTIEQNGYYDQANIVKLEYRMDENSRAQVSFGGNATVKIAGEYYLA